MDNIDATENSASIGQPQVDAQLGVRVHTHATLGSHTIVFQNDLTPVTRRDFGILQEQILVKVAASVKEVIQNELRQSPFPPTMLQRGETDNDEENNFADAEDGDDEDDDPQQRVRKVKKPVQHRSSNKTFFHVCSFSMLILWTQVNCSNRP